MSDLSEPSSTEFHGERLEFLAVLGLAPPVTEEDVKQAYLVKARTAHPDQGGNVEAIQAAARGVRAGDRIRPLQSRAACSG